METGVEDYITSQTGEFQDYSIVKKSKVTELKTKNGKKEKKQYLLRIPNEVVKNLNIKKGDEFIFLIKKPRPKSDEKWVMNFIIKKNG